VCLSRGTVHYRDKETVSWRLSLSGLAVAYNQSVSRYQGPYPKLVETDLTSHKVAVVYDDGKTSIIVKTTDGFEVCDTLHTICIGGGMAEWLALPD